MRQKRFLSWIMVFALLVGMFSFPAYAEGNNTTTTISGDGTADKTGTMTITLVIPKKTPAATDLTFTAPSDLTYSGSDKAATVVAKDSVTGMGDITVKYYSDASRITAATPTNVGTYFVGATVAEGDQYAASSAVLYGDGWTFEITASTPEAPAAPTKASATKNSITLNAVSGCEYSKDGTNWQNGTEFTGLLPGTEYTFYQRVKATANTNASAASSASFSTEADTYAMTITLVIKKTPAASDFTLTTPTDLAYDGNAKTVTAVAKSGVTGMGSVTVEYYKGTEKLAEAPKTPGTYTFKLNVTEGNGYKKAELTDDSWTFTITKGTINPTVKLDGWTAGQTANEPSVTGNLGNGAVTYAYKAKDAENSAYSADVPTEVGEYTVKATIAETENYKSGSATADFTISAVPAPAPTPAPTPSTETITIPVSGEDETVNVTVEVKGDTATVTSADVDKVLEAKDVGTVTVDVSSLKEDVKEVVLPAALVEKVADAVADKSNDASGLEVKLPTATVTFDAKAVAAIKEQSKGKDLHLNLDTIKESALNSAQQATVKDMADAVVLDAYMTSDGKRISDFEGGTATLSVPYTLKDGQSAKGVVAYFVAEDGTKTEVPCTYDGKNANAVVSHFSNYVIAYDAEKAATPEPQPEPEPEPEPTPATPTDIGYNDLTKAEKKNADAVAKALGVDKDTAAQMVKVAAELGVSVDTVKLSGSALAKADVDSSDPAGTDFGKLTARVTKRTNAALTLQWTKQKNADGYLIYGNKCGKGNKMKLLKTVKKNSTVKWTQKSLKKGTYYKYMVVAYKNVNGQKMPIAASVVLHTPTKGGKTTVAKSVKVNKTSVTVKKGKSITIKATEVKDEKKLKVKTHRAVKFESSNPAVATVNAKGTITGKKKGKATIYAYAQNGIYKAVKVTVK